MHNVWKTAVHEGFHVNQNLQQMLIILLVVITLSSQQMHHPGEKGLVFVPSEKTINYELVYASASNRVNRHNKYCSGKLQSINP